MTNDLDTLRPEVRKALATVDFYFNDGAEWTGWPEVRAELLRLASENMELRGANKRMKFLLDSAEAELAALKARIAESPTAIVGRCALNSSPEYNIVTACSPLDGKRVRLVVDEPAERGEG